jgi:uncharacterized protein (DUF2062 family)
VSLDNTPPNGPRSRGIVSRCRGFLYRHLVQPLILSKHPPWYDARGVALGLFVGLAIPIGGHLVTLALLRIALRFHFLVAFAFSAVNNPFTMIPLYYGYYLLGALMLGKTAGIDYELFGRVMHPVMGSSYFWEALAGFGQLSKEILVNWSVAAVVVSLPVAVVGYMVTYGIQRARIRRAAEKMTRQYEEFLGHLREKSPPDE